MIKNTFNPGKCTIILLTMSYFNPPYDHMTLYKYIYIYIYKKYIFFPLWFLFAGSLSLPPAAPRCHQTSSRFCSPAAWKGRRPEEEEEAAEDIN